MHNIQPKSRSEILLFPHVENWVSKDNPIRLLDLIIDKLVMSNPEKFQWKGQTNTGRKSYAPDTMLKLLLYGYLNNLSGSRRLEKDTYRNIELMWLLGELHPDHWTICEYRRENKEQIRFVTIEFRQFLKSENYIDGKTTVFDGSKFKAYASRDMLSMKTIEKRLEKINEKLDEYLDEFHKIDRLENLKEEFADISDGEAINTALIDKIADLQEQIETLESQKNILEKSNKNYLAPNDIEANLMKSRDGKIPAYNGQTGVDKKNKMIVLSEISTAPNDINLLKKNTDKLQKQLGIESEEIEADKGYANTSDIKKLEENSDTECFIPLPKNKSIKKDKENGIEFTYDKENDKFKCSQGESLELKQKNKKKKNQYYNVYQCEECDECSLRKKCTSSKAGRIVHRNVSQDWIDKYKKTNA